MYSEPLYSNIQSNINVKAVYSYNNNKNKNNNIHCGTVKLNNYRKKKKKISAWKQYDLTISLLQTSITFKMNV